MQSPVGNHEPVARSKASISQGYGPWLVALALFAAFDFLVPFTARGIAGLSREGYPSSTFATVGTSDEAGVRFSLALPTPASEFYLPAVLIGTIASHTVQQAVLAVWAALSVGRWPIRLVMAMLTSAGCYLLIETQLLEEADNWENAVRGLAAIPLNILAIIAPIAGWRIWSGRTLSHTRQCSHEVRDAGMARSFAIRDALAITAFVAVALALVRWALLDENQSALIGVYTLFLAIWSAVYVVPLVWGLLAPREARRTFVFGLVYAALWFVIPGAFSWIGNSSSISRGMTVGLALGLSVTASLSFLLWRWCGYRLT